MLKPSIMNHGETFPISIKVSFTLICSWLKETPFLIPTMKNISEEVPGLRVRPSLLRMNQNFFAPVANLL